MLLHFSCEVFVHHYHETMYSSFYLAQSLLVNIINILEFFKSIQYHTTHVITLLKVKCKAMNHDEPSQVVMLAMAAVSEKITS